jgi:arsenate reductase (thioredoxin)
MTLPPRPRSVLFLCTGNTARSILAEGILRKDSAGRIHCYSAGSQPKGVVNPYALMTLADHGYPNEGFRSKSWSEFDGYAAPKMDFVFTVCGNAASEVCPIWPGHPTTAHWGVDDPAAVTGSDAEKSAAFAKAFHELRHRIHAFLALPINAMGPHRLQSELSAIGQMTA